MSVTVPTVLTILFAAACFAENWPRFRGPNGQGGSAEQNVPLQWSATENIAWRAEVPGVGWSSPIVWGNHVFVTTATEGGESGRVLAFDRRSGRLLWNREAVRQKPGHKEKRNSYASPTPATDGKNVYVCSGDGTLAALDFSGRIVWTNRDYPFYGQHGIATSIVLHEGLLIMARDGSSQGADKKLGWQTPWDGGFVFALEAATGKQRWKTGRGASRISHGTPAIWNAPAGGWQVISEAGDVLQGFDGKTGERLWTSEVIGEGKVPSVTVGDGVAFTAGGWGGKESIKAFRLGAGRGDRKELDLIWEQRRGMPKVPSLLYSKSFLFAITDAGIATCLNVSDGSIVWQQRLEGAYSASPVAAEGRVYFLSDDGTTTVVEAASEFRILARNAIGEPVQASPAISGSHLFLRTDKHLIAIGMKRSTTK
ncbi:MAG: hypothetical protein FJW30_16795 [Acidobacteria bacterium]|nr:hypothetical protein [Acidobacteriota bacterium]